LFACFLNLASYILQFDNKFNLIYWFYVFKITQETRKTIYAEISAMFKPTRRKPGYSPDTARLVSDLGTKAAPLLGSWKRGSDMLSVSYRNVSTALSLLNKVCNSIYSNPFIMKHSSLKNWEPEKISCLP
jgi:hypothetical protein